VVLFEVFVSNCQSCPVISGNDLLPCLCSKYLHLTWGFNRLTMSSTQPLTIPGDLLYNQGYEMKPNRRIVVPVTDFEFLDDSLLITTAKEGAVIIVYGLGMAHGHLKSGKGPLYPLRYAVAKG